MRKTKIITTIGPASDNYKTLKSLINNGANVIRINFSHGNQQSHLNTINLVKQLREELNLPIAIMVDTRGPEVRIEDFENSTQKIIKGQLFSFYKSHTLGNSEGISVNVPSALENLKKGNIILANDGLIKFRVISNTKNTVKCKALNSGTLSSKKSLNLKGITLNLPYISSADKEDLIFAFQNQCDYVACSFVNSKEDISQIKDLMKSCNYECKIISKIESEYGLKNIEEILDISDGIMVARGDLGVEISHTKLPFIQRNLIEQARKHNKIVIVATEMLESMITNLRPTRAETSDIATAVYSGTSAIMLSAETATGQNPDKVVKTMADIAEQAEKDMDFEKLFDDKNYETKDMTDIISDLCVKASFKTKAKAIVVYTDAGKYANNLSKYLPKCPIIAITENQKTFYSLSLVRGVNPIMIKKSKLEIFDLATNIVKEYNFAKEQDKIIVATGTTDKLNNVIKVSIID